MNKAKTAASWILGLLCFVPALEAQTKKQPEQGAAPRPLTQQQPADHWTANKAAATEGYEIHTVKQGDTLWDLSRHYLKDPYLWPQIWEMNGHVSNPHWIYPGDEILIKKMVVVSVPPPVDEPAGPPAEQPRAAQVERRRPAQSIIQPPVQQVPAAPATPPQPPAVATYSDLYCAGYFSAELVQPKATLVGGEESENKSLFSDRDVVYLDQGTAGGIKPGDELQIVRLVNEFSKWGKEFGPAKQSKKYGYYYQDVGRLRVLLAQENSSTAEVAFACDEIHVGDKVIAGETRVSPLQKTELRFDRFAAPNDKASGRIFMSKEFRQLVGTNHIIYIDAGGKQNVQVGDYFRVVRPFEKRNISLFNQSEYSKYRSTFDSARKIIGQAVVLRVEPNVSTAIVIHSSQDIAIGDGVEQE